MKTKHTATLFAIGAAALYAINMPFSKLLLTQITPTMMAAFLYLGAGIGLFFYSLATKKTRKSRPLNHIGVTLYHRYDPFGHCRSHFTDVWPSHDQRRQRIPFE